MFKKKYKLTGKANDIVLHESYHRFLIGLWFYWYILNTASGMNAFGEPMRYSYEDLNDEK